MKTTKNELYSIKEAAEAAGYSVTHIRELARRGKIRSIKPNGGKRFITKDALNDFLNGSAD
mgnify:CR=1 FL=1|jgi:excisionase family DNA binding protein